MVVKYIFIQLSLLSKRLLMILISIFLESIFIFSLKRYLFEYFLAKFALVFSKIEVEFTKNIKSL